MSTVRQVLDYLSYNIGTLISDRQTDCGATTFATRSSDNVTTSATESHAISENSAWCECKLGTKSKRKVCNDTDAGVVENVGSRVQRSTCDSTNN